MGGIKPIRDTQPKIPLQSYDILLHTMKDPGNSWICQHRPHHLPKCFPHQGLQHIDNPICSMHSHCTRHMSSMYEGSTWCLGSMVISRVVGRDVSMVESCKGEQT